MFTGNGHTISINREDKILADLLSNAFRSVKHQMNLRPLSSISHLSDVRSRCRLNLYAMNAGILDYFIIRKLGSSAKNYAYNMRKQLVDVICHADPAVFENVEKLIMDKKLLASLNTDEFDENNYRILSKTELLKRYLYLKIKQYHYGVDMNLKMISKNTNRNFDKVTEIFTGDFLGENKKDDHKFSTKFSFNISKKSQQLFYDEIDRIFE